MDESTKRARPMRTAVIAVAIAAAGLLIWKAMNVVLLGFASVLLAIFLWTLAQAVARLTRMPYWLSLMLTIVLLVVLVGGVGLLLWPSISQQIEQLAERLPATWNGLIEWARARGWGRWLTERAQGGQEFGGTVGKAFGYLNTTLGAALNLVVLAIVAVYLAAQPRSYIEGALQLLPPQARPRAREVRDEIGYELRWWLLGQVNGMVLVGVLTWLGLWAIGVPLALALGVLAGLFNFVPNIGPWIAAVPGVLIALSVRPSLVLGTALIYLGAQVIESYFVTPLIQQRNVALPPALLILSQLLIGVVLGPVAVTMAAPALVVALVLVKMLYVEDKLGDRPDLPGRKNGH